MTADARSDARARVLLRPPTQQDRREFLARVRASRALHHPWVQPPDDAETFAAWLAGGRDPSTERHLVIIREDAALGGVFGLSQIFYGPLRSAYLSYYAFEPYAGKGFMSDGLGLVLRHAFGPLRLHRVEANIQPANTASIALVRGAGFRREGFSPRYLKIAGRWRDHERWALLAEDLSGGPTPEIVDRRPPRRAT
jgi:ribosomal-protein-alanine N-acetyltransferase